MKLKAFATVSEDVGLDENTHMVDHSCLEVLFKGILSLWPLRALSMYMVHRYA